LEKQDNAAFLKKLQEKQCCQKQCFTTKINSQTAFNRYYEIKAMTQMESNFCFLGMIDASITTRTLSDRISKTYLTTTYYFCGISICQTAWLTIYGIRRSKWKSLHAHYQQYGLSSKIHKLSRRVSNSAISFFIILYILKFIKNFANQHDLLSPGK